MAPRSVSLDYAKRTAMPVIGKKHVLLRFSTETTANVPEVRGYRSGMYRLGQRDVKGLLVDVCVIGFDV